MACQHCGHTPANRPQSLCWSCYYTPEIRIRYPSTSKFARRGLGCFNGGLALPPVATRALPGTPEKVAVMEQRAGLRVALWHPHDAPADVCLAQNASA